MCASQQYLAESAGLLEGDPDPQEILNDLEQAVADQCTRRMAADQAIVTLAQLEPALAEIGAVQVPGGATAPEQSPRDSARDAARPLRQISEGAVVSGVCQGLARYFALDVTLLRVIAVLLLLATGGGMIPVYLALMLLMPYAPLETADAPLRWLPAKCRKFVEFLRAKLGVERTGHLPA